MKKSNNALYFILEYPTEQCSNNTNRGGYSGIIFYVKNENKANNPQSNANEYRDVAPRNTRVFLSQVKNIYQPTTSFKCKQDH